MKAGSYVASIGRRVSFLGDDTEVIALGQTRVVLRPEAASSFLENLRDIDDDVTMESALDDDDVSLQFEDLVRDNAAAADGDAEALPTEEDAFAMFHDGQRNLEEISLSSNADDSRDSQTNIMMRSHKWSDMVGTTLDSAMWSSSVVNGDDECESRVMSLSYQCSAISPGSRSSRVSTTG
jgi:hypothetical protein